MSRLFLAFYGDDFTGSTDALEQLTLAGIRAVLFVEPPDRKQLARFRGVQAIGVAGMTRSMSPAGMERELMPALKKLKTFGARHVHYKVCSTFDSSPSIGSIGRAIDIGMQIFRPPFVPLLAAAPALGRYTVFGNHFARFGIGSNGEIHRLDQHPSISRHPITPMNEADLRLHLAKQTRRKVGLFDILKVRLSPARARAALDGLLRAGAEIVLFDALDDDELARIGELIDRFASSKRPLFSVGSSAIEMALAEAWKKDAKLHASVRSIPQAGSADQLLVVSGSCSAVTNGQIKWALANGFAAVKVETPALVSERKSRAEIRRASDAAVRRLKSGRSVIVHTGRQNQSLAASNARLVGAALGEIVRVVMGQSELRRVCIAGGDTSSFVARALGIEALEMIASLTLGAPLCRAHAPGSPADGREFVFKGGQVGAENYFQIVKSGS